MEQTTAEATSLEAASVSPVEIRRQEPRIESPLEAYRLTPEEEAAAFGAWQHGMQACMVALGFEFEVFEFDRFPEEPSMASTPDQVVAYGYGLPPGSNARLTNSNDSLVASDPAYREAFLGDEDDGSDGCRDRAQNRVYQSGHPFLAMHDEVVQASIDASIAAESTTAYEQLEAAWSRCMAEAGFAYVHIGDPISEYADDVVTEQEVATRTRDLNCQAEVSFERVVSLLENVAASAWIEANAQWLAEMAEVKASYLADLQTYANSPASDS